MKITRIELRNFRNYDYLILEPHPGINLFFGPNGSGKTNLLEAIHYCALGKSHRISRDENAVLTGEKVASCGIRVQGRLARADLQVRLQPGEAVKKIVYVDQVRVKRFSEMMGKLRCVIFSPEDLSMVRGGPSLRRRFLDMMISQVNPGYFIALQQYRVAMEQRNAILRDTKLRGGTPSGMILDFESAMAENAAVILPERQRQVHALSENCRNIYRRVSGQENEDFLISYHSGLRHPDDAVEEMKSQLLASREDDLRSGLSSVGPHRDDLYLTLNRKDVKLYASQGQIRTAALSMKLAQLQVLKTFGGESPVLLLDDVMSELDQHRRTHLLEEIEDTQTFITFTDETDLENPNVHRSYFVFSENGLAQMTLRNPGILPSSVPLSEPDFFLSENADESFPAERESDIT